MNLDARSLLAVLALCAGLLAQAPADEIAMPRELALSPDGKHVAFSWMNDLWLAPSGGGAVQRLTTSPARDSSPAFSPCGEHLAFVSTRDGASHVYVMPVTGGRPRKVTLHTGGHSLLEWAPDGKHLLVSASRDLWWRRGSRLYLQPLETGLAPELLFDAYGSDARLDAGMKHLLFVREGVRGWRKGYRGSQAAQLWRYDLEKKSFHELEKAPWGTRSPRWTGEGSYVAVCERDGTWNLVRGTVGTDRLDQLTHFVDEGINELTVSRDGAVALFEQGFAIHRMDLKTGASAKVRFTWSGEKLFETESRETLTSASDASFTRNGLEVAFIAGDDLYVMDTVLKEPVRITATACAERDPLFLADGSGIVFSSDSSGEPELWMARRKDTTKPWWRNDTFDLERLTDDSAQESDPRPIPGSKSAISYIRGLGDLVWHDLKSGEKRTLISGWDTPNYSFSPCGQWVVYSVQDDDYNHDVHILATDGKSEPFNVSMHPDNDRGPRWSPDGKFIAFTGRRTGDETDVWWVPLLKETVEKTDRAKRLEEALKKMEKAEKGKKKPAPKKKPATAPKKEASHPMQGRWSGEADGNNLPAAVTFTMEVEVAKDGTISGSFDSNMGGGSISGKALEGGSFKLTCEVDGVVLTVEGKRDGDRLSGTWSSAMGSGDFKATRVPKKAPDAKPAPEAKEDKPAPKRSTAKKGKKTRIDFDGLRERMRRISIPNSSERGLLFGAKGAKLHFSATVNGKRGIHVVDLEKPGSPRFVATSLGSSLHWIEGGKRLGGLQGGSPALISPNGKAQRLSFRTYVTKDLPAFHRAIFDEAWRTMRDRWYDQRLGNNDWDEIRARYGPMAEKAMSTGELSEVCNRMLGELNGSHLGFSMRGGFRRGGSSAGNGKWSLTTVHLGARFDESWKGPGLKIRDVVDGTPAARQATELKAGEIILEINGEKTSPERDIATYLNLRSDERVTLKVRGTDGAERTVEMETTSYGRVRGRLYTQWLENNRKMVEELSGGKLGYLHIQSMGGGNLVKFDEELFKIGHGKEGLLIDVRENGGGSITDHLLTCLCQPTHAITRPRSGGEGYPHDRRIYATWDKPVVVLCNQNSFSNAEIFSHAIKTLGRGKVVGVRTAGGVISTGGRGLLGGAFVRMPFRGWYLLDGQDMELNGCAPHHELWPLPGELPQGIDRQLQKAVEVLSADVKTHQAKPRPRLIKATERRG